MIILKNLEVVYCFAGHSVVPTLALIHSNIAQRYVIMFTKELSDSKSQFSDYIKNKNWDGEGPEIVLHEIDTVGDFVSNYKHITEIVDTEQEYGIFLQNGAKHLILALMLQNQDAPRIFLEEPLNLQIFNHLTLHSEQRVELLPIEVLNARGFSITDELIQGLGIEFDKRGRLEFTKSVIVLTESDVSRMVKLIEKFGRNGAVYNIHYKFASSRIRNTLPPNVHCVKEEEE
mgnify:CR=1 FL=1